MQNVYKGDKLFKAIRKDNGKEVQGAYLEHINRQICVLGDYLKPEDITHYIIFGGFADWNMPIPVQMVEVIPETVVQYIGRNDDDNVPIFDKDLVHWQTTAYSSSIPYRVTWDKQTCRYVLKTKHDVVPITENMKIKIYKGEIKNDE